MEPFRFVCPCLFGLEGILAGEMRRLGLQEVAAENGRVCFRGNAEDLARASLWLRTAERILIEVAAFPAPTFDALFEGVKAVPWENFIGRQDAFPVKGWALNSALHSIPDCQSIIKKAVVERLKSAYGITWFEETGVKYQIQFSIMKDQASIMLDTSGAGLHKRGYRENANAAPLRETLAAAIADLAFVKKDTILCDPFCGSGTILIESALRAKNIAPGIRRRFAAETWGWVGRKPFEDARAEALEKIDPTAGFHAYGGDIDPGAVRLTLQNAKKAGVGKMIDAVCRDVADFSLPTEEAVVICNPPYGERMLDRPAADALAKKMGEVFRRAGAKKIYVITENESFETLFGRPADKRRKLYNGMLRCNLYLYFR